MNNNEFATLKICQRDGVEQLVTILTENGYKVQVTPVYETQEEASNRLARQSFISHPRITHSLVEIVDVVEKPVYTD